MSLQTLWNRIIGRDVLLAQIKQDNDALQKITQSYATDTKYYEDRISFLQGLLNKAITPADLTNFKIGTTPVNPANHVHVDKYSQADEFYYALQEGAWVDCLTKVFDTIRATYTPDVYDCDDFALLFSGILAYSVYKSGYDKQFAFGIAWSKTHAFNVFIDNIGDVYIYEPQNNTIMGKIGELDGDYAVTEVWFMS